MHREERSHGNGFTVGVLGPLLITRDGVRKELPPSRKTRGLLAYLALAGQECRRDDLCELLWEGASDPRSELRWSLAKIRAVVGPSLKVSSAGVALARDSLSVDAVVFCDLAREPSSERTIAAGLRMWRGRPLADVEVQGQQAFHAWLAAERDSLLAQRTGLLKAAVDWAWACPENALSAARHLVAQEPWNEWGHARVVQLLERCGRTGEANAYAAATRQRLSRELGVPEAQLLKLPPPPNQRASADRPGTPRETLRRVVRVEALNIVPPGGDLARLGAQITASLCAGLWRNCCCDVLDGAGISRPQPTDGLDADFAVRGAMAQWGDTAEFSLRCVDVRLGRVVWSEQIELGSALLGSFPQWIRGATEAIGAAIQAADPNPRGTNNLNSRLIMARSLASALQPEATRDHQESRVVTSRGDCPLTLS